MLICIVQLGENKNQLQEVIESPNTFSCLQLDYEASNFADEILEGKVAENEVINHPISESFHLKENIIQDSNFVDLSFESIHGMDKSEEEIEIDESAVESNDFVDAHTKNWGLKILNNVVTSTCSDQEVSLSRDLYVGCPIQGLVSFCL